MERREAQHPGGGPRKPAAVVVRAPGAGFATPPPKSGARAARSQGRLKGVSQTPGASRRSIPFGERKKGSAFPGPIKECGRWCTSPLRSSDAGIACCL